MAAFTGDLSGKHPAGVVFDAGTPDAHVERFLSGVEVFVAIFATCVKGFHHFQVSVPDVTVAFKTVNSLLGDMGRMYRLAGRNPLVFHVALVAGTFYKFPCSLCDFDMAFSAGNPEFQVFFMVEGKSVTGNRFFGSTMTGRASRDGIRRRSAHKVAGKADGFLYHVVTTLNNVRMTGRAPHLYAPKGAT